MSGEAAVIKRTEQPIDDLRRIVTFSTLSHSPANNPENSQ